MGLLNYGVGANAFAQNFMDAYGSGRDRSIRKELLAQQQAQQAEMNAYRQQLFNYQRQQDEAQRMAQQEAMARQADKEQRISGGLLGMLHGVANGDPRQQQALSANTPPEVAQLVVQRNFSDQDFKRNIDAKKDLARFEHSLQPAPKVNYQVQEFEGPQGYGKYLYNPENPSGKNVFLGTVPRPQNDAMKAPSGYQFVQGKDGQTMLSPIPGGPAAMELSEKRQKEESRKAASGQQAGLMVEEIDRALKLSGRGLRHGELPAVGIGDWLSWIPGTNSKNLASVLTPIKARIGFNELQTMRQNSPTGGALGQVAVQELEALQAVQGSLEQSQSAEQFQYNLNRLKKMYLDTVHGAGNWREDWGGGVELKGQTLRFDENGNQVE